MAVRPLAILAQPEQKNAFAKDFTGLICVRQSKCTCNNACLVSIANHHRNRIRPHENYWPMSETTRGNKLILVVMDHFTKRCNAFPTKDQKASTVADLLVSKVFSRFGSPIVLDSDQGSNFESTRMRKICNIMGITKTRTTAYHPWGDGQVERHMICFLIMFPKEQMTGICGMLDTVLFAYNSGEQESTGFTTFKLVFGKLSPMPLGLEFSVTVGNACKYSNTVCKECAKSSKLLGS